jgi:hypothetical protein
VVSAADPLRSLISVFSLCSTRRKSQRVIKLHKQLILGKCNPANVCTVEVQILPYRRDALTSFYVGVITKQPFTVLASPQTNKHTHRHVTRIVFMLKLHMVKAYGTNRATASCIPIMETNES